MKKRSIFKNVLISLLPISLGLGVFLGINKNRVEEAKGYNAASLPTTIDLNDTSAANIRSYYSALNNLSTSERQGTNLLKNLKEILKNDQNYYSYENGTSIWQMYEITDRDWDKSPASSTTYGTYDSSSNKITGYTYGTSASSSKNNPYIHALYINRDINNQTTAWDDHQQTEWGINREHVWPKAEGFDTSGAGGARGDPMHLMAGNGYSNNIHSNYYYGYVKTSESYTDCGSKYSNQSGNLRGTSKTLNSGTVFEPQDCDKGDIARAIFYMVARYNYLSGSDSDGIDTNNPNLSLTQDISDWSSSGYTSSTSRQGKLGVLTDLLNWHRADPVDEYERHRNNLLYTNFTNNRNPFIDFPEWVDFIWGKATYSGNTYQSYSSTPTGYANPNSDTINGYNSGGATVAVTGVSLNKNSTSIEVGGAETLEATIAPLNATNQGVSWSSNNTSVATVSNGIVRGVSEGTATITVTTSDGGYTATCTVTVTASGGQSQTGSATINYSDTFTPAFPTASSSVNTSDTAHVDSTCNFAFKEQGIYKGTSSSYLMFVQDKGFLYNTTDFGTIDSVKVTYSSGTSTTGKVGVYFGSSQVSAYQTSSNQTIAGQSKTDTFNNNTEGKGYFQLSTSNKNVQITKIELSYHETQGDPATLTSISLDTTDVQKSFYVGDTFNHDELAVTANYDNGISDILSSGYEVVAPDMSTAGEKTVTVNYTEGGVTKSASYNITVNAVELTSISVSGYTTSFTVGDSFSFGGTVTANYNNGTSANVTGSATFSGYNMSNIGNQTVTVSFGGQATSYQITVNAAPREKGTSAYPYTVAEARAAIDDSGTLSDKYTKGIIYKVESYNSTYHSLTYWISDDGTGNSSNKDGLQVYSGKGIDGVNFSDTSDLSVGQVVVVKGTLKLYEKNSTYTYEYDKNNELVSLSELCDVSYSLVTDPSKLLTGDEIIFIGTRTSGNVTTYYTMAGISNNVMSCTQLSIIDNVFLPNSDTMTFTIEKSSSGHRFKNSDNQYLATCSNSENLCALECGTLTNNSLFNISSSSNKMAVVGVESGDYSYRNLRFYYTSTNPRFAFYNSTGYISIYKKTTQVNADTWSETFLNSTSNGSFCNVDNWSTLASSYNELSDGAKSEIINVEANSSTYYSYRAQAMARYDYFMTNPKYNQGEHFIVGRASSLSNRPSIVFNQNANNDNLVFITICVVVSLTSLTTLLIIKKRKNIRA